MVRPETRYELIDRLVSHPCGRALFDRYRPALLVASSPGLIFSEVPLLRTAVRRGVRSMAVDPSWDNFTNKLLPVRRVDRLVVWNELMKQQAVELHGYAPDEVRVAGAPQWDLLLPRRPGSTPRDAFFRAIGADPSRKLITLTTTPRELYPHHDHVLRVLIARDRRAARWPHPAQLLVRLHPRDDLDAYAAVRGRAARHHREAVPADVKAGDGLAIDITAENQQHLADTHAPQRRRRQRRVDDRDRGGDLRHAGRQRLVRRRDAVRVGAIGAALLPLHALREHHAPRRRAGGRDAGAAGRVRRPLSRRSRRSIARAAGAVVAEQCQFSRRPRRPSASPCVRAPHELADVPAVRSMSIATMCGIAGFVSLTGRRPIRERLARMVATLRHRGPDDRGLFTDGPAALGAARLSIIDVAGGHQPISIDGGAITVAQNGEIYNYVELRDELERARPHASRPRATPK